MIRFWKLPHNLVRGLPNPFELLLKDDEKSLGNFVSYITKNISSKTKKGKSDEDKDEDAEGKVRQSQQLLGEAEKATQLIIAGETLKNTALAVLGDVEAVEDEIEVVEQGKEVLDLIAEAKKLAQKWLKKLYSSGTSAGVLSSKWLLAGVAMWTGKTTDRVITEDTEQYYEEMKQILMKASQLLQQPNFHKVFMVAILMLRVALMILPQQHTPGKQGVRFYDPDSKTAYVSG